MLQATVLINFLKNITNDVEIIPEANQYLSSMQEYSLYRITYQDKKLAIFFYDLFDNSEGYVTPEYIMKHILGGTDDPCGDVCSTEEEYQQCVEHYRQRVIEFQSKHTRIVNECRRILWEDKQRLENEGFHVIQIYESEWMTMHKRLIWLSVIRNKLGLPKTRIFARKTEVHLIPTSANKHIRTFFDENHLQGAGALGTIKFGLYYNGELISAMTFGKSRFDKNLQGFELIRFASKLGFSVVGGASKLLKAFERTYSPEKIVSYANRRWSDGNLYKKIGFNQSRISEPNYFYFHPDENMYRLYSRNHFQKFKLKKKLAHFDPELNEQLNMFNNGWRRIWDSGNYVFEKIPEK